MGKRLNPLWLIVISWIILSCILSGIWFACPTGKDDTQTVKYKAFCGIGATIINCIICIVVLYLLYRNYKHCYSA